MSDTTEPVGFHMLRLRALIVAIPVALAAGAAGSVFIDPVLERSIEDTGADIVGAKVDVDGADLQLGGGRIVLGRVQVGNPEEPFLNLLEAREVVVDLRMEALLQKKIVADSFVMRGIRFGTPRETSGVLENPSPESGRLWREVNAWADGLNLPEFSLAGLGGLVNTDAIDDDSLSTLALGRSLARDADSLSVHWRAEIGRLDPRPILDSARVLSTRLNEARQNPPNLVEVTRLVRSARSMTTSLATLQTSIKVADSTARSDVAEVRTRVASLPSRVDADMAYGRRLLSLPNLEAPNLSPVLFRETALTWLKPVLYWVNTAERVLPPGLDPRQRVGPLRRRAPGTTVAFPGRAQFPEFLLERGALDLEIGGVGLEAGSYEGSVQGLSSAPALSGQPLRIEVSRTQAPRGPHTIQLSVSLNHAQRPLRDDVQVGIGGVTLPAINLPDLGTRLLLGSGDAEFALVRTGDQIDARLRWASDNVRWEGTPTIEGDSTALGSAAWTRAFVWRALRGVTRLELEMGLQGTLSNPSLRIESNLGTVLGESLRAEVGEEVRRAEARLRSEVESRIQPVISQARARADALQTLVAEQLAPLADEVEDLRVRLERAATDLVPRPDV